MDCSKNYCDCSLSSRHCHTDNDDYMFYYIGLILGLIVISALRAFIFFMMTAIASRNLHNAMFGNLLRTPISFFDTNPIGEH